MKAKQKGTVVNRLYKKNASLKKIVNSILFYLRNALFKLFWNQIGSRF